MTTDVTQAYSLGILDVNEARTVVLTHLGLAGEDDTSEDGTSE